MSAAAPQGSYVLAVRDVFRFGDGSTVFLCEVRDGQAIARLTPAIADVVVEGRVVARVVLSEERLPGPASHGQRTVVTRDKIDVSVVRSGRCVLRCSITSTV